MAKNISVDSTSKFPPKHKRVAEIRHAFDEAQKKGIRKTGPHQGQRNRLERLPSAGPKVWAASSIDGETPSTTPIRTRNAIGVNASVCAIRIPGIP